jgi:hypothetical protein
MLSTMGVTRDKRSLRPPLHPYQPSLVNPHRGPTGGTSAGARKPEGYYTVPPNVTQSRSTT